jgi:hypothetical protein
MAIEAPEDAARREPTRAPKRAPAATPTPEADASEPDRLVVRKAKVVPGKGFSFATADERFVLVVRARIQPRYELEHDASSTQQVFQIRRARLQLLGNVFGRHNKYYVQFGFTPRDMTGGLIADEGSPRRNPLRDARIEFDYLRDLTVWIGQMKVPFSRQRVISDGNLDAIDRSIANEEFNLDRDVGVQVLSADLGGLKGRLGYALGVFMGEGRNTFQRTDSGMLYVARFEVRPLGAFDDAIEGDLERSRRPGLGIGGAYAFHDNAQGNRSVHGERPVDGGTTDYHHATADIVFKWRGLALETAFHWRRGLQRTNGGALGPTGRPQPTEPARSGVGWFGQLGWLLPRISLELVTRYALIRNPYGDASSVTREDEAGGGLNYYIAGHNLKIQADYYYLWNQTSEVGLAASRDTHRLRLQVQLAF